jgi:LysM repeat protein
MDGPVAAVVPVAAVSPVIVHRISVVSAVSYRVKPGDYLSKISAKFYHKAADWPVIYWANHKSIHYPNVITAGQVLLIPALPTHIPAPPAVLAPTAPRPLVDAATPPATQQKIVEQAAPVRTAPSSGYSVSSSFQACVIRAESGGNSQIWNASGHYGLYQFSAATWAAYGGSAADFGHASAAEQTQVFDNAMATAGGASNWAPYDGC